MIIHLLMDEKFTPEFITLVDQEFNQKKKEHVFLIVTSHERLRYEIKGDLDKVFIRQNAKSLLKLFQYLRRADRIIAHGLFNPYLICILKIAGVGHKTVWAIWGGDLYDYKEEKGIFKYIKHKLVQEFCGVTTPIDGDVELARKIYGFQGHYYPSMMYLSNIVSESDCEDSQIVPHDRYTIMIGNSADSENRHMYILNKLRGLHLSDVRLVLPLSYGPQNNADEVEKAYKDVFGETVLCLRTFMPKEKYLKLLSEVDVVLFAHNRQQGVGNLVQLINIGAKVYLEPYVTTYQWLNKIGIQVFDFETINEDVMNPLDTVIKQRNRDIIREMASREKLIRQWRDIFAS